MNKIASPQDLQHELSTVLAYARTEAPSRSRIAHALDDLAGRITRRPRTAAVGPQVLYLGKITTKARNGLWELDEKYIGTEDYMGVAYFWDLEYKFELRDASPNVRRAVHAAFLKAKLKVDDVSDEHAAIIKSIIR